MHLEDERGQSCHAYAFLSRYDSYEEYQHERLKREEYRRDYEKREFERAEQRERQKQKAIVSQLTQTLAACVPLFFFCVLAAAAEKRGHAVTGSARAEIHANTRRPPADTRASLAMRDPPARFHVPPC